MCYDNTKVTGIGIDHDLFLIQQAVLVTVTQCGEVMIVEVEGPPGGGKEPSSKAAHHV